MWRAPPLQGLYCQLDTSDFRIGAIPFNMLFLHSPAHFPLSWFRNFSKVGHRSEVHLKPFATIHDYCEVWLAIERLAGGLHFFKIADRHTYRSLFSPAVSTPTLDGNSHKFVSVAITCNEVDPGMVNSGALERISGEPVEAQWLPRNHQ